MEIVCFPGQRICAANESTLAGSGTYERLGYIFSSLAGIVETTTQDKVCLFHYIKIKLYFTYKSCFSEQYNKC